MSMYGIAKRGLGLLGKNKKSTDTIKIKPSGKKTETEKYLKNRKPPTKYEKPKQKIRSKKKPDKVEQAFKNMKNYFKEVEKTPEMKAYRKKENWPKPGKK